MKCLCTHSSGTYNTYNSQDQETVWPTQNMINFPLSLVTELKLKRNAAKRRGMKVRAIKTFIRYTILIIEK